MQISHWIFFVTFLLTINHSVQGDDISEITIEIPSFLTSSLGEKDKIDSKLDFNTSEEDSSTTPRHSGSHGGKKSPKIQGVRVTVDTGKAKKSAESGSKESVEIVESKKGKRVGIHTDITFELTDDDDNNSTSSSDKDDTDASVPVYRGRDRGTTHRPRKPYDPKTYHWQANQPHHRDQGNNNHHHYQPSQPAYPRTNDEEPYRGLQDWSGFMPVTSVWTTERSYYGSAAYQPKSATGFKNYDTSGGVRWKPCYCVSTDGRNRRDSRVGYIKIDDKLENPFNSQQQQNQQHNSNLQKR